jgi:Asp-tRNA(Asn)/Glu-tRNA(Gln) amidotransferase B subunit
LGSRETGRLINETGLRTWYNQGSNPCDPIMSQVTDIINEKGLWKVQPEDCISTIQNVINENQESVQEYKNGNEKALNSLVGKILKTMNGKSDGKTIRSLLIIELNKKE